MAERIKGLTIQIGGDTSGLDAALRRTQKQLQSTGKKITAIGKTLTAALTVPIVAAATASVKNFAEVDKTMTLVNATMGNTEEEANLLSKAMKSAASNSTYGMSDAAEAMLNFARAGLSAEQAAATIAPAMDLAAGEGGDLATVSAGLIATINGFHGSFDDAAHYADVFANACNNSALDVNSMADAMSVAAPIFAAAGYSISDAALYMGIMANNGIDADKAANALKTGLARLVSPAKSGKEWMDKLGISVTEADGSMKDSVTVQKELHNAFAGLSESEQIAAASAIFGKNQMAAWLALINTAPEDVEELSEALAEEGTTSEMASEMMSGFGGSLEKLKSSIDVAAYSFGEALAPVISKVADVIQKLVDWFNSLDKEQQQMIATIAIVVAAIGPLLIIIGQVMSAISALMPVFSALSGVMSGPVVLAIGAVIAIGAYLIKHWDEVKAVAQGLARSVSEAWDGLKTGISNAVESIKTGVGNAWESITTTTSNIWNGIKATITGIAESIKSSVSGAFDSLKNAINSVFTNIKTSAQNIWNSITTTFQNAINKIKSMFSFNFNFPHIKVPHFHVSEGWNVLGIRLPRISVEWYKKAYENPYLFTNPTVVGGRGFGDGGGSGEIVYGRDALMRDIAEASSGEITINVYASEGMDVNELADRIQSRLAQVQRQRMSAYA